MKSCASIRLSVNVESLSKFEPVIILLIVVIKSHNRIKGENIMFTECSENGHEYAEKVCPQCEQEFCYACCDGQNVDQGGKYEKDYMFCPHCGQDYYE